MKNNIIKMYFLLIIITIAFGIVMAGITPKPQTHQAQEIEGATIFSDSNLTLGFLKNNSFASTSELYNINGSNIDIKSSATYSDGRFYTNITFKDLKDNSIKTVYNQSYSGRLYVYPITRASGTYSLETILVINQNNIIVHTTIQKRMGLLNSTIKRALLTGDF